MNHPIYYTFDDQNLRVLMIGDEPWFVAADAASALQYQTAKDMARNLDDDEKGRQIVPTPGGKQQMLIINESGLYSAILCSRKPEAKRFKKWITAEVLPSLRKHGTHTMPAANCEQTFAPPMAEHIEADRIVNAGRVFNALFRTGRHMGMDRRLAATRANQAAERSTGVDMVAELGASAWLDNSDLPTPHRRQYELQQQIREHLAANDWPQGLTGPVLIEALNLTNDRATQMAVGQCLPLLGYRRVRLPATKQNGIRPWGYLLQHRMATEEMSE